MNAKGLIPQSLKALLIKMLAIDPSKRVPLYSLVKDDEWLNQGPESEGGMLIMPEYKATMDYLYRKLVP